MQVFDKIISDRGSRYAVSGGPAADRAAVAAMLAELTRVKRFQKATHHSWAAILGFALAGVGLSNIVPVFYSAVGRQKTMPENVAVPAITTLGYIGILMGPAGIGFVAHLSSLGAAFLIIAVMLLGVAISGRYLKV